MPRRPRRTRWRSSRWGRAIASGKLATPAEVVWAYTAGLDMAVSAQSASSRPQAMNCNRNICPTGIATRDRRMQRGLDPSETSVRARDFVDRTRRAVEAISHASGVDHPRALQRFHLRLTQADGQSRPMDELRPLPCPCAAGPEPRPAVPAPGAAA